MTCEERKKIMTILSKKPYGSEMGEVMCKSLIIPLSVYLYFCASFPVLLTVII